MAESEGMPCPECGERSPLGCTVCSGCGGSLVPDEPKAISGGDAEAADDDLLDDFGAKPPPAGPAQDEPRADDAVESAPGIEHVIAGPGRRLLGAAVDVAVWAVVGMGLSYTAVSGDDAPIAHEVTMTGLTASYEIVSVAIWGRTIGKVVAGTRVVALESGAIPGWSPAVLRWAVPWIVGLGTFFSGDGLAGLAAVVSGVLTIVVYVGVLQPPLRQGVHDRVAGTVVVLAPRPGEVAVDRTSAGSIGTVPPAP